MWSRENRDHLGGIEGYDASGGVVGGDKGGRQEGVRRIVLVYRGLQRTIGTKDSSHKNPGLKSTLSNHSFTGMSSGRGLLAPYPSGLIRLRPHWRASSARGLPRQLRVPLGCPKLLGLLESVIGLNSIPGGQYSTGDLAIFGVDGGGRNDGEEGREKEAIGGQKLGTGNWEPVIRQMGERIEG
jgi:hypothetical protein